MKTVWVKGLDEPERTEMKGEYNNAHRVRSRLIEIIEDMIENERKKNRSESLYEIVNWQYKQADSLGYERALDDVIGLLKNNSEK
jgi:hypothetical protein